MFIVSKYPGTTIRTSASGSSFRGGGCPSTENGSAAATVTSCTGRIEMAEADRTPAVERRFATTSSKNLTSDRRSRYFVFGRNTCAATRLSGLNPGLTSRSFRKLLVIKLAPTRSTSASATSIVTSVFKVRRVLRLDVEPADSVRLSLKLLRDAC